MAMFEVRVSGGFSDVLVAPLTDALGVDLTTATVTAALVPEGAGWPAADATAWKTTDAELGAGGGTVAQRIDYTAGLGHFHWYLRVTSGQLDLVVLVMDPDVPSRPWHIWLH